VTETEIDRPTSAVHVDVIGIGASAGGLLPLRALVAALPADLRATVIVVLHVAATGTSVLPQILARSTKLTVVAAEDGLPLRPGEIVVATPDHHVVVDDGVLRVTRGPRENGHRPAIDPLLRSIAESRGAAGAGVVLSGARDDGSQGLAEIKRHGGLALVQEPADAEYPSMPASAMAATTVDGALSPEALAAALVEAVDGGRSVATRMVNPKFGTVKPAETITCPDCGGVLTETDDGGVLHFRCHVGHAYSPRSLLALHADAVERAMWTAARSLEDRRTLLERMARRARDVGNDRSAERFMANAARAHDESLAIRQAIAALDDAYTAEMPNGREAVE
jgi:two-component system chemotaxis response regulator CheB